jgi:hypothetical protein
MIYRIETATIGWPIGQPALCVGILKRACAGAAIYRQICRDILNRQERDGGGKSR